MMAPPFNLVVVGHVDHGKSTLIGRLLHEAGALPGGKVDELRQASERRGVPLEWSFVLDSLQAERDQAVTIDTTRFCLTIDSRDLVIIDAPGHREFLANMVSGAAGADAAVLVVDAAEGLQDQTRRHAYLLRLLGLEEVAAVVNKVDLVDFSETRFRALEGETRALLEGLGIRPRVVLPTSARHGDNVTRASPRLPWYEGPTLAQTLAGFAPAATAEAAPLRFPIQDVYRQDDQRILVGRIESGRIAVGDTLLFSPSNKLARVKSLEAWPGPRPESAGAGRSIGVILDRPLFVERGEVASHVEHAPLRANRFRASVFWLGAEALREGYDDRLRLGTREVPVTVERIERVIDTDTLATVELGRVERDQVAELLLRSPALLALDDHARLPRTGRFVLRGNGATLAGGFASLRDVADQRPALSDKDEHLTPVAHKVTRGARAARFAHKGGVLWLTGLSAAGKSTLAMAVEQHLFRKGYAVYVLDGDNIRSGLNADLGFSPEDRVENIRRVGEVAALFADAGFLCITAFISPYRADRARARAATPPGGFHEIYVSADLATCEARDPKGLYRKARAGEIRDFTGISAPYEPPETPSLVVDTVEAPLEACVEQILAYVEQHFARGRVEEERGGERA
ncbi:MAG TPA: adenylyl-sulfate kinase [Stellaceae bacterium]|nr:adenylyl-sulfate kinase [Stellaceae bacterium]